MSDPKIQPGQEVKYQASYSSPKTNGQELDTEEVFEFEDNDTALTDRFQTDKKLKREVNGEQRYIRVGRKDGKKYRYTADTEEELVTKTTTGKNTYLTKTEFDRMVKEILKVDTIPTSIKPELRDGYIVFIDKETGLTMSPEELRQNSELIAAQGLKETNDKFRANINSDLLALSAEDLHKSLGINLPVAEVTDINIPKLEIKTDTPKIDESTFKIDPNWYTEEGVQSLEKEWSNLAPKSRGFTHEFYQGIVNISKEILCDPDNLMSILNAESSLKPNIKTGLMGFVKQTRDNFSTKDFTFDPRKMSPVQQLPYIRKCLIESKELAYGKNSNHALSPGELYGIVFVPGYVRGALANPRQELVSKRSNNPQKRIYYNHPVNRRLDIGNKGYISIGDLAKRIEQKNAYNTCRKLHIAYNGERHLPNITPRRDDVLLASNNTKGKTAPAETPQFTEEEIAALAENGINYENIQPYMLQEVVIIGDKNKSIAKNKKPQNDV